MHLKIRIKGCDGTFSVRDVTHPSRDGNVWVIFQNRAQHQYHRDDIEVLGCASCEEPVTYAHHEGFWLHKRTQSDTCCG